MFSLLISLSLFATATASDIIVDFNDGTSTAELKDISSLTNSNLHWVDFESADEGIAIGSGNDATIEKLKKLSVVESVEYRKKYAVYGNVLSGNVVNDPDFSKQWHMTHSSIDAPWVWKHTSSGKGVKVAVLDTGLTVTKDFSPENVASGAKSFTGDPVDDFHGHGTHCASTIAQWTGNGFATVGLATNATILPVKVLSDDGFGYNDWIASGIYYAVEQKADVISMSLGGSQSSDVINKAIDKAIEAGVIVVAAAGNDGCLNCVGYPGAYDPVLSVGAIGPDNKRSYYSSYGRGLDIMAPGGNKQLPGGGVWQWISMGGIESLQEFQGTSMATPHVAAAVAVLLGEGAPHNQEEMTKLLLDTATKHSEDTTNEYGNGTINLPEAVTKTINNGKLPGFNSMNTLVNVLAIMMVFIVGSFKNADKRFMALSAVTTVFVSTALSMATGLSLYELPNLLYPHLSGMPLWLSPLPAFLPFVFLTPVRYARPFVAGVLAYSASYLTLNSIFSFNDLWWLSQSYAAAYSMTGAVIVTGLLIATFDYERLNKKEK